MLKEYPDYRIVCLDKLTYAGNLSTLAPVMDNPNFRFVKADICDREAVNKLFEEEHPDIVVNFAAESHVDRSMVTGRMSNNTLVHFQGDASLVGKIVNVSLDECHGFYYMGHMVQS